MGKVKVKLAKAHESQIKNFNVERELRDVQKYVDGDSLTWPKDGIGMLFLRGLYDDFSKK